MDKEIPILRQAPPMASRHLLGLVLGFGMPKMTPSASFSTPPMVVPEVHSVQNPIPVEPVPAQNTAPTHVHSGPLAEVPSNFFPLPSVNNIRTPIKVDVLRRYLLSHPDRNLVEFLLDGFTFGFSVGVLGGSVKGGKTKNNRSALQHHKGLGEAILKELNRGHTAGPFDIPPVKRFSFFTSWG